MTSTLAVEVEPLIAEHPGSHLVEGTDPLLVEIPRLELPSGWSAPTTPIWFAIPSGYPAAQPDCFWADGGLRLAGGALPQNSGVQTLPASDRSFGSPGTWACGGLDVTSSFRTSDLSPRDSSMFAELRFTAATYQQLLSHLLAPDGVEHAAILSCGYVEAGGSRILLARRVIPLGTVDVVTSDRGDYLKIAPTALAREAKDAAHRREAVVVVHSHPFSGPVAASPIDLVTERELCGRVLAARTGRSAGALVVGPEGIDGRLWSDGTPEPMAIRVGGRLVTDVLNVPPDDRVARQLLVWDAVGQARLAAARVVVVGAGGTGSHVAVQLAHLGMGAIALVDDDVVETSNLSRLIGATAADIGAPKVDVIGRHLRRVRPDLQLTTVCRSVLDADPAEMASADLVVCCTDGHSSRAWLTELAAQYLVTLIDMGIEVQAADSATRAGGGIRVCRPGEACLHCVGVIDPAQVRVELLTPAELDAEVARGYVRGLETQAPSVVALNGVIASLAVIEIVNELVGLFTQHPARLLYRAEARALTTAATVSDDRCYVCGSEGVIGLGSDRLPLGIRRNAS